MFSDGLSIPDMCDELADVQVGRREEMTKQCLPDSWLLCPEFCLRTIIFGSKEGSGLCDPCFISEACRALCFDYECLDDLPEASIQLTLTLKQKFHVRKTQYITLFVGAAVTPGANFAVL